MTGNFFISRAAVSLRNASPSLIPSRVVQKTNIDLHAARTWI